MNWFKQWSEESGYYKTERMKPDWFNFSEYRSQIKRDASVLAVCFITSVFLLGIYFCVEYGERIDVICNRFLK